MDKRQPVEAVRRQVYSSYEECRETCDFCCGLGLLRKGPLQPETAPIQSCSFWSMNAFETPIYEGSENLKEYFVPQKYLQGGAFLSRLRQGSFQCKSLNLLIDSENFDLEIFDHMRSEIFSEVWVVLKRNQNLEKLLRQIGRSRERFKNVYFYSPEYSIDPHKFLTTTEVFKKLESLKDLFPDLQIKTPPGVDVFNPKVNPQDLKLSHSVLFEKFRPHEKRASIVIPCRDNPSYVLRVLEGLEEQDCKFSTFEVIVVDDGSETGNSTKLNNELKSRSFDFDIRLIRYHSTSGEEGVHSLNFRAGLARNLGSMYARGSILGFLDSDILVPPNYISHLIEMHDSYDVVQFQRLYLTQKSTERIHHYRDVDVERDIFHPEGQYWKKFFDDPRPWQEMECFWKYVCTYGLSIRTKLFRELGGFRSNFSTYGFEDTDLGYRLSQKGAKFLKSDLSAFHLWHPTHGQKGRNSEVSRIKMLETTGRLFFRNNLSLEAYRELSALIGQARYIRERLGLPCP